MSSASTIAASHSNGAARHPVPGAREKLNLPSPQQGKARRKQRGRTDDASSRLDCTASKSCGHPGRDVLLCSSLRAGVTPVNVVVEDLEEVGDDGVALEGELEGAIDEHRGLGLLEGAGQRDADVGVLALPGAVDDAAHDGHAEVLDARVAR